MNKEKILELTKRYHKIEEEIEIYGDPIAILRKELMASDFFQIRKGVMVKSSDLLAIIPVKSALEIEHDEILEELSELLK